MRTANRFGFDYETGEWADGWTPEDGDPETDAAAADSEVEGQPESSVTK